MFLHGKSRFVQSRQSSFATFSLYFRAAVFFVGLFIISSTSVQAVATYQDAWGEGDDADVQYIVGCGVTEANYGDDWELHNVKAVTTLRSPNGRSVTRTRSVYYTWNDGSSFAARAEPVLLGDESDIGDYTLSSTFSSACPATPLGTAFFRFPVGTFRQTYGYRGFIPAQGEHWYSVDCIGPCTATYPQNRYFSTFRGAFYVCSGIRVTFRGSTCVGRCRGSGLHEGCY